MKCKIFKNAGEEEINEFLKKVIVKFVTSSDCYPGSHYLIIFYKNKNDCKEV